jgi:hypothetical protein
MPEHFSEKWRRGFRGKFCSVRCAISQGWRNRFGTKSERSNQERRGAGEAARDPGLSASDLRALASHGPGVDSLLRRRMEALHLDPNELAQSDPFLLGDLQRLCAMCKSRRACALELEHVSADVAWGEWREYCPNAVTLNELRIRSRMRFNPTVFK